MDFLHHFFVNTWDSKVVETIIQQYAGTAPAYEVNETDDLSEQILAEREAIPNYYVLNCCQENWLSVEVNSFKRLYELAELISGELKTVFIQTLYCTFGDYAYFLMYKDGKLVRELERWGEERELKVDKGDTFSFETGETEMFDLDIIAHYCLHFKIDISNPFSAKSCRVLHKDDGRAILGRSGRAVMSEWWGQ